VLLEAMEEEFGGLWEMGTFLLIEDNELPAGVKPLPISATWKVSKTSDPLQMKVKCRMHVEGNRQPLWQITDTYSPTARPTTLRLFLALAAQLHLHMHVKDVEKAYLNASAPGDIYVRLPKRLSGFSRDRIARLELALYGLPEAGRAWHEHVSQLLLTHHYTRLVSDPSAFFLRQGDSILLINLYVDDFAVFTSSLPLLDQLDSDLASSGLIIGTQGPLEKFLGLRIAATNDAITVSQSTFVHDALDKAHMTTCKLQNAPTQRNYDGDDTAVHQESLSFAELPKPLMQKNGLIRYLADMTRFDILFAACKALQDPTEASVDRIFGYLRKQPDRALHLRHSPHGITFTTYCDASFNQGGSGASYYAYAIFANELSAAICVQAKKITSIQPQSVMEAEHYCVSEAVKSVLHLRNIMYELGMGLTEPSRILTDNSSSIFISNQLAYTQMSRHFRPRRHAIRHHIMREDVILVHVATDKNWVCAGTK
jgi:hypothetical protein